MLPQLQARADLILTVLSYEHRLNGDVAQYKAIVQLVDGSRLHINEVWIANALHKYAYYRLTPTGALLQGWDNAPHHPHISTYPHHIHTPSEIAQSLIRSLGDVLSELTRQLLEYP